MIDISKVWKTDETRNKWRIEIKNDYCSHFSRRAIAGKGGNHGLWEDEGVGNRPMVGLGRSRVFHEYQKRLKVPNGRGKS